MTLQHRSAIGTGLLGMICALGCSSPADANAGPQIAGTTGSNQAGSSSAGTTGSGSSGREAAAGADNEEASSGGQSAGGASPRGGSGGLNGAGASGSGGTGGTGGSGGAPAVAVQPFAGTPLSGYRLEWADEFNGESLDSSKWTYRTDSKHWSTQLPANVSVSDGMLNLRLKKESAGGKDYTGAGTISKPAFRDGYYEARLQTPPGRGWHSSFWMMKHDGSGGTGPASTSIELDVIENDSIDPLGYSVNTHRWNPAPHLTYGTKGIRVPAGSPALSSDFHVYGCELTPETLKYFLDGALVQTVDATQFPHGDLNIWLTSIASFLGGTASVDDSKLPALMQVDYVRYFVDARAP